MRKARLVVGLAAVVVVAQAAISSGSPGDPLILGQSNDAGTTNTTLVTNTSGNAFSVDQNGSGTGVWAEGATYGVYGYTTSSNGFGVYGGSASSGRGVSGTSRSGTGVHAEAGSSGIALRVVGKAVFERSGVLTIRAASSSATKSSIPLTSSSLVLAMLQQNRTGRWVSAVVPNVSTSSFTVYLNQPVSADTRVAWFVVN